MRIGILSDTHHSSGTDRTRGGCPGGRGVEALIHCGDVTGPETVHTRGVLGPSDFVLGNHDSEEPGPGATIAAVGRTCLGLGGEFALGGKRIAVTHGRCAPPFRRLLRAQPDYLLSGHTHRVRNWRAGCTRHI